MCLCKYVGSVGDVNMRDVQTLSTSGRGCVFSGGSCRAQSCRQSVGVKTIIDILPCRNNNGIMMTEYNPNYEFAGGSCSIQDLREVDRENLILVK